VILVLVKTIVITPSCDRLTRNLTFREWQRYLGEDERYRKTCENLDWPDDLPEGYEVETASPLSALSHWVTTRISAALP